MCLNSGVNHGGGAKRLPTGLAKLDYFSPNIVFVFRDLLNMYKIIFIT